jgi:hypothetical protein
MGDDRRIRAVRLRTAARDLGTRGVGRANAKEGGVNERWRKGRSALRWLPAFLWQRIIRRHPRGMPLHLMIAVADHFEPSFVPDDPETWAPLDVQERRLERWCRVFPRTFVGYRDTDGRPFRHTYFYPAEQYHKALIDRLAHHCRAGWGELEVHMHHGRDVPGDPVQTRRVLLGFRDQLAARGCLSRLDDIGEPRYAFVHGNWALANVTGGYRCGVDGEMQILADTGCYADFTLPSAPDPTQVGKINALYECGLPLGERAPHRRGRDLEVGRRPQVFPLIMQGPLALELIRDGRGRPKPRVENGELSAQHPPSVARFQLWQRAAITVQGRPDWVFVKLHCHGMDTRDEQAMTGPVMQRFLEEMMAAAAAGNARLHFVSAREMVNIALAACDGAEGDPGQYRDYRLRPLKQARSRPGPPIIAHDTAVRGRSL